MGRSSMKAAVRIGVQRTMSMEVRPCLIYPKWPGTIRAAGDGLSATGGGASILFAKPSWQTGPGVPNDAARDVPDVSLAASNDHDPYLIYANGELLYVGGTSVSTPVFSAIVTLLNRVFSLQWPSVAPWARQYQSTLYQLGAKHNGSVSRHHGGQQHCSLRERQPELRQRPIGV